MAHHQRHRNKVVNGHGTFIGGKYCLVVPWASVAATPIKDLWKVSHSPARAIVGVQEIFDRAKFEAFCLDPEVFRKQYCGTFSSHAVFDGETITPTHPQPGDKWTISDGAKSVDMTELIDSAWQKLQERIAAREPQCTAIIDYGFIGTDPIGHGCENPAMYHLYPDDRAAICPQCYGFVLGIGNHSHAKRVGIGVNGSMHVYEAMTEDLTPPAPAPRSSAPPSPQGP